MKKFIFTVLIAVFPAVMFAQRTSSGNVTTAKKQHHSFYASWGYNTEWYTHSDVKVSQPELGNDYTLQNVTGHDHRGWDNHLLKQQLSIPQYNARIGYIINEEKGIGAEINFDHTKYIITEPQLIKIKGKVDEGTVDGTIDFQHKNGFFYYLNNGANFLLFNITKREKIYATRNKLVQVDAFGKFGVGPVIPHVENSFFGKLNTPHFQLGGWNTGLEAAIRVTLFKYTYLEYCNKLDYARYSGLKIYKGTVSQAFGTYEMILNIGVTL